MKKILIVEDDSHINQMICEALGKMHSGITAYGPGESGKLFFEANRQYRTGGIMK